MTATLIGQVCTAQGLIHQHDLAGNAYAWELPAVGYERAQHRVPIVVGHDETWQLGEAAYFERSRTDGLLVVARLHALGPIDDGHDWYLSPDVSSRPCGPLESNHGTIHELSVVPRTGSVNTRPLRWSPHDLARSGGGEPRGLALRWRETWARAHEAINGDRYRYLRDDTLRIVDMDQLDLIDEVLCDPEVAARVKAEAEETKRRAAMLDMARSHDVNAERYAVEHGLGGYSYVGADGERRYVRHSGKLYPV
jgi:hypothetical protein